MIVVSSVKVNQLSLIPDKVRIDSFLQDLDDYFFWTRVNITNEVSVLPVQNLSGLGQYFQLLLLSDEICRNGALNLAMIIFGYFEIGFTLAQ